jgi:hypothetical protein
MATSASRLIPTVPGLRRPFVGFDVIVPVSVELNDSTTGTPRRRSSSWMALTGSGAEPERAKRSACSGSRYPSQARMLRWWVAPAVYQVGRRDRRQSKKVSSSNEGGQMTLPPASRGAVKPELMPCM